MPYGGRSTMHEILTALVEGTRVLDLGSGRGSFNAQQFQLRVVRADLACAKAERCGVRRVFGVAAALPGAIISSRHFEP